MKTKNEQPDRCGRILRVDLSSGRWKLETLNPETRHTYLGGIGLASRILYEETGPQVDPLSDENIVVISAGLLNGTDAPTAYRTEVTTKSPLTGIIGTGNFGGLFGSRLKKAGIDAIVFRGRSLFPVYLKIENDRIELKRADSLWGKDTWQTTDALRKGEGEDFSIMAIGPAGENLVRFACPIVDYYHAPGRSHAGCVLGGKKLKAVIVKGTGTIGISWPDSFYETKAEIEARIKDFPEKGLRAKVGSTYFVADTAKRGGLGAKNYQTGILPRSNEIWRPEEFTKYLVKGPPFCGRCLLSSYYGCNTTLNLKEGPYAGLYLEGAGFSHPVWNWGSKCAIESFPAMLKCKELCNRYGMDQMGPVPFALELFQRGILKKEDLGGEELNWGDAETIMDLLKKIAHRMGIGDVLAEGSARAGERLGEEAGRCALTVKGMEFFPGSDPRKSGAATNLGNMVCLRGGDDVKSTHTAPEGLPGWARTQGIEEQRYLEWFLDRLDMPKDVKEKIYGTPPSLRFSHHDQSAALMTKWYEDLSTVRDSLGICLFAVNPWSAIGSNYSAKLVSAYLGIDYSPEELMTAGERICNLIKAYNAREGLNRKDDNLPSRFFSEPLEDGASEGPVLSKERMDHLLDAYYDWRGWNKATGLPTVETLNQLGLKHVAEELSTKGRIG
jgi:aldehyde:ferredoxin oxidoreductase